MTCRLCDNEAGWDGWDGDPEDHKSRRITVCGLHMVSGDTPIRQREGGR